LVDLGGLRRFATSAAGTPNPSRRRNQPDSNQARPTAARNAENTKNTKNTKTEQERLAHVEVVSAESSRDVATP